MSATAEVLLGQQAATLVLDSIGFEWECGVCHMQSDDRAESWAHRHCSRCNALVRGWPSNSGRCVECFR